MDYKTKRTVLSSAVMISSFIVCLVCAIVLAQGLGYAKAGQHKNTPTPAKNTPTNQVSTLPPTTASQTAPDRTPTQSYENPPYTTGAQATTPPKSTISVTSEPPAPTAPIDQAELLYFDAKLTDFSNSTANYAVTVRFNAAGTVRMVAVNSDRMLTGADVNPNFIRTMINGGNRDILSTPQSFTSATADANTDVTLNIQTGTKQVDFFIIIDTDVENGMMSESIVKKGQGFQIPTITGSTAPSITEDGYLTFVVTVTQEATVCVQLKNGTENKGTLVETATNGQATFTTEYKEEYAGISLVAYLQFKGVTSTYRMELPSVPAA